MTGGSKGEKGAGKGAGTRKSLQKGDDGGVGAEECKISRKVEKEKRRLERVLGLMEACTYPSSLSVFNLTFLSPLSLSFPLRSTGPCTWTPSRGATTIRARWWYSASTTSRSSSPSSSLPTTGGCREGWGGHSSTITSPTHFLVCLFLRSGG